MIDIIQSALIVVLFGLNIALALKLWVITGDCVKIRDYRDGLRELERSKADAHAYLKIGDAWAVMKKPPRYVGSFFTMGNKTDRHDFVGDEIRTAYKLQSRWGGEIVYHNQCQTPADWRWESRSHNALHDEEANK
ncbi:MAG: hypothetical protein LKJ69_01595 [Lactobacillus sp.]|jgi:hypothetical protein|nr:hypothetical protein [Lactobacillus sp.]MCI2032077.1 hypothetical protein [Lactobacillus sp.]